MSAKAVPARVCLMRCSDYSENEVAKAILKGLKIMNTEIHGRVVIKPNLVFAHAQKAPSAYTRPEVVAGLLEGIRGPDVSGVSIVEKSGVGVSTHVMFRRAGYRMLAERYGVDLCPLEEEEKRRVPLEQGRVHQSLLLSKKMLEADTLIFMPKLKSNVLAHGLTAALKLNIGSLDDRERMWHHDHLLDEKIVDILSVVYPQLVVSDAVEIAMGGNQMTEHGHALGLIILADNPLAHDLVAARLLHLDPADIGHLQAAIRRGFTPANPDEIEIIGDYPVEEIMAKTAGIATGMMRVEEFASPLKIRCGTPYCTGGCQGIFLDWLHMLKDRSPERLGRLPEIPVIIGQTEEEITAPRLLLIGDCAIRSLHLHGKRLEIAGCPPTHRDLILQMALKTRVLAPFVRADLIWDAYAIYPWRKWLKRRNRHQGEGDATEGPPWSS
ncbi:hypothetical protein CEB3_c44650 [Peptococcaceae bacterium CEB3]|nr:hypothetical protein CEB3_c44650 [Peptococcaceae bacterium CEB3]